MEIDIDRIARSPFAVGALGSLVALRFAPGTSWAARAFNVLAGSLVAGFCAPALAEWLHITGAGVHAGVSFGVGLFGLSLADAVVRGVQGLKLADIISGWISRRGQ